MTKQATGQFSIKSWDEKPYSEAEGEAKLTHASVTQDYAGDIQGTGTLAYLMAYAPDGTAHFTGLELVRGSLHGRSGSFVLHHSGMFQEGVAASDFSVVEGSATGELAGLRGTGQYAAKHGESAVSVTLNYELGS